MYFFIPVTDIYFDANNRKLIMPKGRPVQVAKGLYTDIISSTKYKGYYVEIQGRTLFEEGWSEIDHDIVYPYYTDDEMLQDYSKLLNRLSGLADEMSSYFRKLKDQR